MSVVDIVVGAMIVCWLGAIIFVCTQFPTASKEHEKHVNREMRRQANAVEQKRQIRATQMEWR